MCVNKSGSIEKEKEGNSNQNLSGGTYVVGLSSWRDPVLPDDVCCWCHCPFLFGLLMLSVPPEELGSSRAEERKMGTDNFNQLSEPV